LGTGGEKSRRDQNLKGFLDHTHLVFDAAF
jgi:hypothetical protein